MKKILIISVTIILIPSFVVLFLINEDKIIEKKYEFIENKDNTVRVMREDTKKIEVVSLEEYVCGVVAGEMPIYFEEEALKAQAVAARNYVYKKIEENKNSNYDVVDSTANQVYKNTEDLKKLWGSKYIEYINKLRQAVAQTVGEYVTYNGEVISLFYFSTSNGFTEDSVNVFGEDLPYLKSVESKWDIEENKNYQKNTEFDRNEFCKKLEISCENINISNIVRDTSNRITSIDINNKTFNGRYLYNTLKLRSTDFEISVKNDKIIFKTTGFGHGVGMSQYGANGMAKEGKNYKEILTYYYTGTEVKKL